MVIHHPFPSAGPPEGHIAYEEVVRHDTDLVLVYLYVLVYMWVYEYGWQHLWRPEEGVGAAVGDGSEPLI